MKNKKNLIITAAVIIIAYVALTVLIEAGLLTRQMKSLIVPMGINIILAVSLNLLVGFLGELTLGHAGFMAIGAYVSGIFTLNVDLPMVVELILALLIGGVAAGIFGFLIGMPVLRLKGDYLAIVTLAFGEIIKTVIIALDVTGGAKGLNKIEKHTTVSNYTLVFILMVITVLVVKNIINSRHGRAICAIRDNAIAAEATGIKISRYKVMAFVISAFFAGIAGVLFAHNYGSIKADRFDYNRSIEILVIVVLGGLGRIKGSIVAAIILTLLPELLRGADDYRMLLYAIVLILIMIFNSSGLRDRLKDYMNSKKKQPLPQEGE